MAAMKATAEKTSKPGSPTPAAKAHKPLMSRAGGGSEFLKPAAVPGVQAKMTVNKPGDKFEQEADKTADKVMRMATPGTGPDKVQRAPQDKVQRRHEEQILRAADDKGRGGRREEQIFRAVDDKVQKAEDHKLQKAEDHKLQKADDKQIQKADDPKIQKAEDHKVQKADDHKLQKAGDPKIQKAEADRIQKAPAGNEHLQRDVAGGGGGGGGAAGAGGGVGGNVQSAIHGKTTGGEPLSPGVRSHMEPRFGADFSNIRVHRDAESASLSNQLSARAFTYQNHIFFSRDQYQPASSDGQFLLAHELTHTIQQGHAPQTDATHQVSTAATTPPVQRLGVQDALDKFAEWAYAIPGFRLLTLIMGFNPINMRSADRNAANVLRGLIELMPGGSLITMALDNYGIVNKAAAWIEAKLAELGDIGGEIVGALKAFLDSLSWTDIFDLGGVWERAKRIFTEPINHLISFAGTTALELLKMVKDAVLKPLAALAQGTRGYDLLCAVLGQDPVTGEAVPRTADTLLGGFMKLIGQEEIWDNIKKGNAVARAYAWFQNALGSLMAMVNAIPGKIIATIESLTFVDVVSIAGIFTKVGGAFLNIAGDFISWGLSTIWDLLKIIFDVVKPGLMGYLQKTGGALKGILKNPMPFLGNLVSAGKLGFTNFASHIGAHLKAGIIDWLTGSLQGVYIPKAATLLEIGKMALSIMGISWAQIRGKFVAALGPSGDKIMSGLELAFDVIKALKDGGVAAVWDLIKEKLTDLKDQVIGGIVSFVTDTIVKKAIPKIISMFIPGAGFIPAIISIYDTVMVFVEKLTKIIQVVKAFVDGIVAIAQGNIGPAAAKVESTLAGLLSLSISFLAGFLGLNKITDKIMGVISGIRGKVDAAITVAVNWVVAKAKSLFASLFGGKGEKDDRTPEKKAADLKQGIAEGTDLLRKNKAKPSGVAAQLAPVKSNYRLSALALVTTTADDGKQKSHIHGAVNPEMDGGDVDTDDDDDDIDAQAIWDEVVADLDKQKQTKLDPTSTAHARQQVAAVFAESNVPAAAADSALATIDSLLAGALAATTGDAITAKMASVGGVANRALKKAGSGTELNAHHVQQVAENRGTFPKTAARRQNIPLPYQNMIKKWVGDQKKAGVKGLKTKANQVKALLKAQLFDQRNPNAPDGPVDLVEMIITTERAHSAAHSAMDREDAAEKAKQITAPPVKEPA
ncbi:MAG TPA: DUF4157 domain-containing protein [Rhizomicrobium sp.]|jgi:hypothetical protein|nr:DUF4157 domain-containing protein [Rhizomicrobium sp.]